MKYFASLSFIALAIIAVSPDTAFAQLQFVPLTGVPGIDPNTTAVEPYIQALYRLAIGIAAALAVLKIILAGVKLMTSQIVPERSDAKKEIGGALLGLLLILGAVTILNEINPNITKFSVFGDAPTITVQHTTSNECPAGQILMECATDDSAYFECRAPDDTDWCEGTITEEEDLNPYDETNTGTWRVSINGTDAAGNSPAMQASNLEDLCEEEGGEPELEYATNGDVRGVICHK